MSTNHLIELYEELDDLEDSQVKPPSIGRTSKKRLSKKHEMETKLFLRAQEIAREFQFTYKAARFEEVWLLDALNDLAENNWISDVLRKVKGGKEASVYLCQTGQAVTDRPENGWVAAKVYRPRMLRNLKNDAQYREGRIDLDNEGRVIHKDADLHAMAKRTAYGEELRHQSWIAYEFRAMQTLFEAGADVPRPYALTGNSILMDFIGDEVVSAPTLSEVRLGRAESQPLFDRVLHNLEILLANGFVHGDLSAFNILYWDGEIRLIDFPQVVSPVGNRNAFAIFKRDVTRICDYFAKQGVQSQPNRLAQDLWLRHGYKVQPEVHPRLLDPEDTRDRKRWEQQD